MNSEHILHGAATDKFAATFLPAASNCAEYSWNADGPVF